MLQYTVYFVEKNSKNVWAIFESWSLMSVLTKTNAIHQNGHDFGRPQYSVAIVISLTGHIKHAKEPYHICLNLRTVRIMCWIDKIDNIDRISAREKVSIVVFITRQNGGKASFGRSVCNSWRNILANSANYKAFRGKVLMSTSDMIIIESCWCIGNTTWSVWIEKYHRKPHVCIHLLKQNGDLWTTIWNKWCKEGKIFNQKWKCCCQGEGILVLHLNIILPPLQHYFQNAVKSCWEGEEVWTKML